MQEQRAAPESLGEAPFVPLINKVTVASEWLAWFDRTERPLHKLNAAEL